MINNNSDEWTCYHCGFKNPYTLRVARKDICIKCKEEKISLDDVASEQYFRISDLKLELAQLDNKIRVKREWVEGLESEVRPERQRLNDLLHEKEELLREIAELEKKSVATAEDGDNRNTREIHKTQTRLV